MRHSNIGRKFSRTPSHRKVLMQNLTKALLLNGKIRTTVMKAKDLRRVVEPIITQARRKELHSRRLAYKNLNDHRLVQYLFDVVAPVFEGMPGGYTRVVRFAMPRKGDNAPMALIEFVKPLPQKFERKKAKAKTDEEEAKD